MGGRLRRVTPIRPESAPAPNRPPRDERTASRSAADPAVIQQNRADFEGRRGWANALLLRTTFARPLRRAAGRQRVRHALGRGFRRPGSANPGRPEAVPEVARAGRAGGLGRETAPHDWY